MIEGPNLARMPATLRDAARLLTRLFSEAGIDTPALDARLLMAAALGVDQAELLRCSDQALGSAARRQIATMATRRLAREPVSRIIGQRWFHGLQFEIGPATLDPRPETETLVEGVLSRIEQDQGLAGAKLRILDLGTGSGAILIALLASLLAATGIGTDIDPAALQIARRNARRHGVGDRAEFQLSDWLDGVEGRFDLIVSNPPYIETAMLAELEAEVGRFDPRAALDGGSDGLAAYRQIIAQAEPHLVGGGLLALEVGAGQARRVVRLCDDAGYLSADLAGQFWPDLAGHERCVAVRARGRA